MTLLKVYFPTHPATMQLILHHPALIVPAGRGRAAPCCSRHASNLSFTKRSVKPGIGRYTSMFSPKHHALRRSRNAARYPPAPSTHSLPADGPSCRHNLPKVDMCPRVCPPASRETSVTVSFIGGALHLNTLRACLYPSSGDARLSASK